MPLATRPDDSVVSIPYVKCVASGDDVYIELRVKRHE